MANQHEAGIQPPNEARFVPLPQRVIRDVVINPNMLRQGGIADPFLRQWMDPKFVITHAAIFAAGSPSRGVPLHQPPSTYNSATLFRGFQMEDPMKNQFQIIEVQGVGLTPKAVEQHDDKTQKRKNRIVPYRARSANGL